MSTITLRLFFLTTIFGALYGDSDGSGTKNVGLIVNGDDAPVGKYPWQAMLFEKKKDFFFCGGTIINERWILTAAHCLFKVKASDLYVAVGKHEMATDTGPEQYSDFKRFINHEDYNRRTEANDISLVELETPLTFDEFVQPVTLAELGDEPKKPCWASGFGVTNERTDAIAETLQELKTKVLTQKRCKRFARKYGAADDITPQVVCTKDRKSGVCSGDSGGPLGCFSRGNYTQYGVLSWGSTKCIKGFNVFTRVSEYRDWITSNMS